MALLGNKKTSKKEASAEVVVQSSIASILIAPRITEKAAILSEQNIYTFDVAPNANKSEIKKAIKVQYGVDAVDVRIVRKKPVSIWRRGWGRTKTEKKAYIQLKKGDSITLA